MATIQKIQTKVNAQDMDQFSFSGYPEKSPVLVPNHVAQHRGWRDGLDNGDGFTFEKPGQEQKGERRGRSRKHLTLPALGWRNPCLAGPPRHFEEPAHLTQQPRTGHRAENIIKGNTLYATKLASDGPWTSWGTQNYSIKPIVRSSRTPL